jgi:hypothetical protein
MKGQISSLDEFWPFYVSQHLNPVNRRLHFVGTTIGMGLAGVGIVLRAPVYVAAALIAAYGFAWVGHFGFERNKPATFQYPWLSFLADFRMYQLIATGRMDDEITRLAPDLKRLRGS